MKIGIVSDNTVALHTRAFAQFVNKHSKKLKCEAITARLRFDLREIEYDGALKKIGPDLQKELESFDVALLITAIPYSNNFFYSGYGGKCIVSLSGWGELTTLPMSNGVAYMLCEILIGIMGIGEDHNENTACINDFLWKKTGIDAGMRAAFICDECRTSSQGNPYLESQEFADVVTILDAISSASRRGADILAESTEAQPNAVRLATFLCHNSIDKPLVRKLNEALKEANILTWLDEERIQPGQRWQRVLESTIESIGACLIIVGDSGFGPWQDMEQGAFIDEFVRRQCKVIPVLIGNSTKPPDIPLMLRQFMWSDLRTNDSLQLIRLLRALETR